jgi:hypothetical protein
VEDAHLLKNILADNGIEAHVVNEDLTSGLGPGMGWIAAAGVAVSEKDAAVARQIASDFDRQEAADMPAEAAPATVTAPDGIAWPVCPQCGARRTAVCPACQTEGTEFSPADVSPDAEPDEASPPMLICPECEEPFVPGYVQRCPQCGYQIEPEQDVAPEGLRDRLLTWGWVVGVISVVLVTAVIILAFLVRMR